MKMHLLVFVILHLFSTTGAHINAQSIIYVKEGALGNGSSWQSALGSLQQAIDIASAGDTILIAKGVYVPEKQWDVVEDREVTGEPRQTTFVLKAGLALFGGFEGDETDPTSAGTLQNRDFLINETILTGDLNGDDEFINSANDYEYRNYAENTYHVVTSINMDMPTKVDGITITGGYADGGNSWESDNSNGAGWYSRAHSQVDNKVEISHIVFRQNYAELIGGAIYNLSELGGESDIRIHQSDFVQNASSDKGGALGLVSFFGGHNINLDKCIVEYNRSVTGAGVYAAQSLNNNSTTTIQNSLIVHNSAEEHGGGISFGAFESGASNLLQVINCTLSQNQAMGNGGALYNDAFNSPLFIEIVNSVFWKNEGNGRSWFNKYAQGSQGDFLLEVSHTLLEEKNRSELDLNGGILDLHMENLLFDTDPLFDGESDFKLSENSPAIDQGDNTLFSETDASDLAGNTRINNDIIDLGAYEFHKEVVVSIDDLVYSRVSIFPNPATESLQVNNVPNAVSALYISDISGKIMRYKEVKGQSMSIDISDLLNGIYVIHIGNERIKFIKR